MFALFFVCIITVIILYSNIHGMNSMLKINLKKGNEITLKLGEEYKEPGYSAKYGNKDLSKNVKIKGEIDNLKMGEYKIVYQVRYKKIKKERIRKVKVIDGVKPEITLTGGDVTVILGNNYKEPGYSAFDNNDGEITDKVQVTNNINVNKIGDYEIKYTVEDSSQNKNTVVRKIKVIDKKNIAQEIAVLNYHFFYDPDKGEKCDEIICEKVSDFREQLNYLRDNNYKTLTMQEFRDWMYGVTELPEKSVLITIDDGAMGTGTHNGNKLIPILEEYKMHATLFLIAGWWDIKNYQSDYLDIQSHTYDMHTGGVCSHAERGAKMLCSSDDQVRSDLKKSIAIVKSKLSFCFPFYAYNDNTVKIVKEVGFELAFIGGNTKASRSNDKYHVPRFPIQTDTTLKEFINYVN